MEAVARKAYPSDVTDEQWELIEIVIPAARPGGRPREVVMREVINAMLYITRSGCQWDMLPHDLPAKSTGGGKGDILLFRFQAGAAARTYRRF